MMAELAPPWGKWASAAKELSWPTMLDKKETHHLELFNSQEDHK